jgi:D-tyrosyl-tRNA(Tyr) deacylase
MRVVLQRVSRASVRVGGRTVGSIGPGLLLLVGFKGADGDDEIDWMARKIVGLRVFNDHDHKMNLSIEEVGGDLLVVSQFTLYGDARKGRRPSFVAAAEPALAEALYQRFTARLRNLFKGGVEEGEFGAMMDVDLVNDGPVTLVIDRDRE